VNEAILPDYEAIRKQYQGSLRPAIQGGDHVGLCVEPDLRVVDAVEPVGDEIVLASFVSGKVRMLRYLAAAVTIAAALWVVFGLPQPAARTTLEQLAIRR